MTHKETPTPPDRLAAGMGVGQHVQPRSNSTAEPFRMFYSRVGVSVLAIALALTLILLPLRWEIC